MQNLSGGLDNRYPSFSYYHQKHFVRIEWENSWKTTNKQTNKQTGTKSFSHLE